MGALTFALIASTSIELLQQLTHAPHRARLDAIGRCHAAGRTPADGA